MRANSKMLSIVVSPPPHVCAFSFLYHIHVLTFWAFSCVVFLSNTALLNGLYYREQNFWLKEGSSQDLSIILVLNCRFRNLTSKKNPSQE